jgi:hypothetical protein
VSLLPVPTVLAAGNITGTVYQDYNANGARDTSGTAPNLAIDAGVGGVTVTAYSAAGAVVATATSSSLPATLGQYTLNLGAVADSTPLRIEFTGLPSGFQPAPHGSNNATNLRFASATAAAQGGLDFGIMRPAEYCQNNPTLFTTCFTSGDPLAGGTAATGDALIAYPYTAIGQNPALLSHLTLSQQIGATWGLAYRRATHQLFTGALMKRHAGLGPLGTGGLYVVDYSNPALPATSNFLDLQTLAGVSTGTDPRSAPGYPALPANKNVSSLDPGAFDAVGKIGLGGIDLSTDENTLYVMNLNSRELLAVDLASKTLVSRTAVGNPGCTNAADVRPWAVKVHDGQVYIGVVCSAQSSGNRADLDFLIARLNGGAFTTVFNGDLGYTKGATHSSFPAACNRWEPWATTFADLVRIGSVAAGTRVCRPQPILSDLEFDTDGSIIAGFVDRTGHQTGVSQRATSAADATLYSGYVNGDILRIYNNAGTFVLESGGTTPAGGGCGLNGQGPGGGEFYCGEFYSSLHNETSLGGLARWPGANELPLTVMDPLDIFSGGVSWMNNSTGADNRRYELFSNTIGGAVPITNTGTFGKAAGLGDIEALCDAAPIEIGNRVWSDTNQNGIQDAGEPGIAGVTVTLYDDAGAAVPNASAITDGSGAYFFSSAAGTNSTSAIYNLPIAPNTSYSIRIDNPADFGPGGVLADAALAPANADASANGDTRDSDAVANAPGDVRIAVGTGPAGANDHTYDAGFTPQLRLGNLVWDDANNNGLKDPAESGIGSVPVNLYRDSDNNGVPDGLAIDTTLTVAGVYTFTGLISDTYIVEIVPPPGYRSSTGANGAAIGPYEGAATPDPDSNIDGDDNGTSAGATIRSKPIALAANSEPDVGVDGDGTSGNLTVDFGLFQPYSLGNRVWFDLNNNGAIDPGESGIANQPVYLLSSDGTTLISSTSTLNGGYYRFDNLGAGDYRVAAETPAGYISSTRGEEADPNADGDSNDNGVTVNGTTMRSAPVTLGASAEPTGETDLGTGGQGAADNHANMTVDFGFTQPVALGNLIWFDADNNHLFDLGESGIVSVTVQLFPAGANPLTSTATLTTTTAGGGFYVFDQLAPGQYFAFIPPSQFGPGGAAAAPAPTTIWTRTVSIARPPAPPVSAAWSTRCCRTACRSLRPARAAIPARSTMITST